MTPQERELILDLLAIVPGGRTESVPEAEFLRSFRPGVNDSRRLTGELLETAYRQRNSDDVECALMIGFGFGFSLEHLDILCRLSDADWHMAHENIVSALDLLNDKRAVDVLYRAALKQHKYLDYDDARALAVKAIWALGNMADPSADEKLELLAQSNNSIVKDNAANQLRRRRAKL